MVLASIGAGVVGLHLIPFFVTDMSWLLVLLAMAGVGNTSVVVFIDPTLLLLVVATSVSLLIMTLVVSTSGIKASSSRRCTAPCVPEITVPKAVSCVRGGPRTLDMRP